MATNNSQNLSQDLSSPSQTGNNYSSQVSPTIETNPSLPVVSFDIPEPGGMSCRFVYNYFEKNEKTSRKGNIKIVNLSRSSKEEQEYYKKNLEPPRYVEIKIIPADNGFNPKSLKGLSSKYRSRSGLFKVQRPPTFGMHIDLSKHLDKIISEDNVTNALFSGFIMKDTGANQKFYQILSSSMIVKKIDPASEDSGNDQGKKLAAEVDIKSITGESNRLIVQSFSNLQSAGVTYINNDNEQISTPTDITPVANLEWKFKINNLFVNNVIKASANDACSVYEDEIRAAKDRSSKKQENAIQNTDPSKISEDEYDTFLAPEKTITMVKSSTGGKQFRQRLLGYIIEKFEEFDGNFTSLDPLIVYNPRASTIIDEQVKYGARYTYNIKSIVMTEFDAISVDPEGSIDDQLVKLTMLISSKGLMADVECYENVPPRPPTDLRFSYDWGRDNILISWSFPPNKQRDIKKFQIFRRSNTSEAYKLMAQYDFDDSSIKSAPRENIPKYLNTKMKVGSTLYRDVDFTKDSTYIYAVCAIDARNLTSGYSLQMQVSFDKKSNKLVQKLISRSGAPKPYPNMFLNEDLFTDTLRDSGHKRMTLFFDPEYYKVSKKNGNGADVPLNIVAIDKTRPTYQLQIINVDMQKSISIPISVDDKSGPPLEIPASDIKMF